MNSENVVAGLFIIGLAIGILAAGFGIINYGLVPLIGETTENLESGSIDSAQLGWGIVYLVLYALGLLFLLWVFIAFVVSGIIAFFSNKL